MYTAIAVFFFFLCTCFLLYCFGGFDIFSSYKLTSDISVMLYLLEITQTTQ